MSKKTLSIEATLIAVGFSAWAIPAAAYLDPATGSIILQGLLAGTAGVLVVVRLYWKRFKALYRRIRGLAPLPEEGAGSIDPPAPDKA